MVLEDLAAIVPPSDACLRLPRTRLQGVCQATFEVARQRTPDRLFNLFQIHYAFQTPPVSLDVLVVVVSHDLWRKVRNA